MIIFLQNHMNTQSHNVAKLTKSEILNFLYQVKKNNLVATKIEKGDKW